MSYAEGTVVSSEKSRAEIERLVRTHGAVTVGTFYDSEQAVVTFATADRMVKFSVPMPQHTDKSMRARAVGRSTWRTPTTVELQKVCEAEERRRWRCLLLVIKAKLEAVDSRVESFDEAFLAHIVTPGGRTIIEEIRIIEKTGGQRMLGAVDG